MLKYLQKIGKALMIPVAVLPAAAVLMGIGYWIDPTGWGANSQLSAFLIKAGAALIDNMAILFAIGVAFGLSKDNHGASALAGLVSFQIVTTLLSTGAVAQITGVPQDQVSPAFAKINNQFIGILCGVISGELYNKFHNFELPKFLAFFSGRRFVPIITSLFSIIVSFILLYVWPTIFGALVSFGTNIAGLGPIGAGIYGFINRLLIPVGLHHPLNSVFWFNVAGINDIGRFLGDKAAAYADLPEKIQASYTVGMYQAGFFPIMMFGLLGAAAAFVYTAKKENKNEIMSIMVAAGFASFFTGVTEPIEFAFMFVAPVLYLVHALLTGLSVFIAATLKSIAGFGFSAGFVDFVLSLKNPNANNPYLLILLGLVFFALYFVIFVALIKAFNLKTPGREDAVSKENDTTKVGTHYDRAVKILEYLGGNDNLVEIDNCATRLRLTVKDSDLVDEAKMKKVAPGVIKLSKESVQVIIGPEVEFVADALKKVVK